MSQLRKPIVVVIDDEIMLLRAILRMLGPCYDVRTYERAGDALAYLDGASCDAILCDMHLPDMTGMDIFEELSSLRPDLAERILFMTGSSTAPGMEKLLEEHRDRVLYKPFSKEELLARLARIMGQHAH